MDSKNQKKDKQAFTVELTIDQYERLRLLATKEVRSIRKQAAAILIEALKDG